MTNKIYLFIVVAIIASVAGFLFHKNSLISSAQETDMLYQLTFETSNEEKTNLQKYKVNCSYSYRNL